MRAQKGFTTAIQNLKRFSGSPVIPVRSRSEGWSGGFLLAVSERRIFLAKPASTDLDPAWIQGYDPSFYQVSTTAVRTGTSTLCAVVKVYACAPSSLAPLWICRGSLRSSPRHRGEERKHSSARTSPSFIQASNLRRKVQKAEYQPFFSSR